MGEPLASVVYNPIPSPVFKRKIEEQSSVNKTTNNHTNEPTTPKKKRNRTSAKKAAAEAANANIPVTKKEEPVEHEMPDIKPTISTSNIISTVNVTDYTCEWDNCRR
jgi:hypothetical protein